MILLYLILYSLGRFFIEGLRTDSLYWGQFRVSQVLSGLLIISGIVMFVIRRKKHSAVRKKSKKKRVNPSSFVLAKFN